MTPRFAASRPDRPEMEVRVGGAAVDPLVQADVVEVEVSEEVNRHGRCVLLVQNWEPDTRTVRWSDDGPFLPGAELEVLLGYHSDLAPVFDGVVTALAASFPAERPPLLRVEARTRSALLARPARSRVLEEVTDGDVVRAVAADHGLDAETEDGAAHPAVVLHARGDWELLAGRAEELGWVTYVRGRTLVFHPPAAPADPLRLEWTLNLTELHLTEDVAAVDAAARATGWDPATQEPVEADADAGRSGIGVGDRADHTAAVDAAGWPLRERVLPSPLPRSAQEVDLVATGAARTAALRHVSGAGRTLGTPGLRCDAWVEVAGVGDRFGGPHYVSAVRHRMSRRGYSTEFQLGLPEPLVPTRRTTGCTTGCTTGAPAGAPVLGVVVDVLDPQGWGRIRVALPWRPDGDAGVWARLATLDAGPRQGTFFLPDVGQEVAVAFLAGDPAQPVVLGSLWNAVQEPPVEPDADNAVRAVVTRSGHRLTFDDADPGTVTLESAGGLRVALDDGEGALTLSEPQADNCVRVSAAGVELTAASGDITLKAPTGAVTIEAMTLTGKAQSTAALESTASLDLKASATLGLRGALVRIN